MHFDEHHRPLFVSFLVNKKEVSAQTEGNLRDNSMCSGLVEHSLDTRQLLIHRTVS